MKIILNKHRLTYKAVVSALGVFTVGIIVLLLAGYLAWYFVTYDWFVPDWLLWDV